MSGTGLAAIFLEKEKDACYSIKIFLTCTVLVLSKDAGMMFAAVLAVAYVLELWCGRREKLTGKLLGIRLLRTAGAILSVLLPKWLWSYHLKVTNARILFSNPVDLKVLYEVLFSGVWSYRRTVLGRYVRALFGNSVRIGSTGVYTSYFLIAMGFLALLVFLVWKYKKQEKGYWTKGIRLFAIACLQFGLYIIGLVIMYLFKFSENEALNLASFERYMGIVFLSVWVVIVLLALVYLERFTEQKYVTGLVLLGLMILVTPIQYVKTYINRESIEYAATIRNRYEQLLSLIEETVPEGANIFLVSQEDNGFDRLVLRYSIRPRRASSEYWSIGEAFYEEDIYTKEIDAGQWMEYLITDFDYVALYRVNEYFVENYGKLFEQDTQIQENMVYWVNKETGLLETAEQ